ncbi:MAG TPA: hypothetical protein QF611_17065, partial [Pseudomonadales bacterium]|nr:hypothetical protein [Pseudomonadales bacterium]
YIIKFVHCHCGSLFRSNPNRIMAQPIHIRLTISADLGRITAIYNHYVINTAVTFNTTSWATEARIPWMQLHP